MSERTALYRHFDSADRLLYVGISLCAVGRLAQHRSDKPWYQEIARVTVKWFPSRAEALAAEAQAIRDENPAHNVQRPVPYRSSAAAFGSDWIVESLVGCYFYTWADEARKRVEFQGQFVGDMGGGFFVVEFFEWFMGTPTNCRLVNISTVQAEGWYLFRDKAEREDWDERNKHKLGLRS